MPKNKGKGGKSYRSGKKLNENTRRELLLKSEGLEYGIITTVLGGAKVHVKPFYSNDTKLGYIRGPIYKKEWITKDDIVLISLRDFEPSKCDIVWKYKDYEIKQLQKSGEIPSDSSLQDESNFDFIEFDNSSSETDVKDNDDSFIDGIDDDFIDNI